MSGFSRYSGVATTGEPVHEGHEMESIWLCTDCKPDGGGAYEPKGYVLEWLEDSRYDCDETCHNCGVSGADEDE